MTDNAHNAGAFSANSETLDIRDKFRLLLCARTPVDSQQREQIRALARKPLDWNFVLTRAQPHALEKQRFHCKARERLRDRFPIYRNLAKVAFAAIVLPNFHDHELIELPVALSALNYLLQPARLIHKPWTNTIRRSDSLP